MTDTPDIPDTAESEPLDLKLAICVVEMLATPQLVCRHRKCRRGNRCHYHVIEEGVPDCVGNFRNAQLDAFVALYADAFYVRNNWRGLNLIPPEAEQRELRDAAFEVVRRTLPRHEWPAFSRRLRIRQQAAC